jgi:peptidyl-prolyl cis-trans isomerase SurA
MRPLFHCVTILLLVATLSSAETIDRIVATVNGRPLMESQLAEQLRVEQFLGGKPVEVVPIAGQRVALERLVDQTLLEQQMDAVNFPTPGDEEVNKRMQELRQQIAPNRSSDAWQRSLSSYGLSEADLTEHVASELRILHFIDARFRPAVRVDRSAVETYYREQLVPKMKQAGADPLPLKQVEPRIQEILMQQQIDDLLESWLKTLRSQAEIRLSGPSSSLGAAQPATQAHAAEVH